MPQISMGGFLKFCESLRGEEVCTIKRRAKFTVEVIDAGLEFIPLATGKPRLHRMPYVKGVLEIFNKNQSFVVRDYNHYTVNASYQLALIQRYITSSCAV